MEDVRDDEVQAAGRGPGQGGEGLAGVADLGGDVDAGPLPGKVLFDEVEQRAVHLDHALAGAGAGGGEVAGQGQGASAEVEGVHRSTHRSVLGPVRPVLPVEGVDEVAEAPGVLELQVGRVTEVDVGLRGVVQGQQPAAVVVDVGEQLRPPEVGRAQHGQSFVGRGVLHREVLRCGNRIGHLGHVRSIGAGPESPSRPRLPAGIVRGSGRRGPGVP